MWSFYCKIKEELARSYDVTQLHCPRHWHRDERSLVLQRRIVTNKYCEHQARIVPVTFVSFYNWLGPLCCLGNTDIPL